MNFYNLKAQIFQKLLVKYAKRLIKVNALNKNFIIVLTVNLIYVLYAIPFINIKYHLKPYIFIFQIFLNIVYCSFIKYSTNTINPTHNLNQEQSQFLFSEINKKLMADDSLNLSGIDEKYMSPKIIPKNKLKDELYYSDINYNKSKNIFKNKINEEIFEEDKSQSPGNEVIGIQINSDKESLISILSELL